MPPQDAKRGRFLRRDPARNWPALAGSGYRWLRLGMSGDDPVLELGKFGVGQDFLRYEIARVLVRPALHDLGGVGVGDAQPLQIGGGRAVDVDHRRLWRDSSLRRG